MPKPSSLLRAILLALVLAASARANAPAIVQRVPVGPYEYVLYSNGNIYVDNGLARKLLDDGTGTVMIAGEHNSLAILKKTSQIWWYDGKGWNLIDEGEGTTKITMQQGQIYATKANGDMWRCTMAKSQTGEWVPDWARCQPVALPATAEKPVGEVEARSGRE
jgi:hypothetical protein